MTNKTKDEVKRVIYDARRGGLDMDAIAQAVDEYYHKNVIAELAETLENVLKGDDWWTKEKTCPACCPDGDDPDWSPVGNEKEAFCGYDCNHPLTVITAKQILENYHKKTGGE